MRTLITIAVIFSLIACSEKDRTDESKHTLIRAPQVTSSIIVADNAKIPTCTLCSEEDIAKQYPELFKHKGPDLEIRLLNGKTKTFTNDDDKEDVASNAFWTFSEYFPEINYGVLHVQLYEGGLDELINLKTGAITDVGGSGVLSPDKRRLAVFNNGGDGFGVNILAVYFVYSHFLVNEYVSNSGQWGAEQLEWKDNKTISFLEDYNNPKLGGDDKPFKEKHTLRFDGKDISGHGNWINDIDDIGKKSEAPAEPKSIQASSNVSSNESSNTPDEITKALEKLNEITPNNIELPLVVIEGDEILVEGYALSEQIPKDYVRSLEDTKIGAVNVKEIVEEFRDDVRVQHFKILIQPRVSISKETDKPTSLPEPNLPKSEIQIAKSKYLAKDYDGAIVLFKKLADEGNEEAILTLGDMYYRGLGTSTDHSLAFLWYKKAAGNGNKIAQKHIAAMYEMGDGTAISKSEADIWQKKADQNK